MQGRAPRQLRTPRRLLEVLPVELLRDAGAGSSPVHCDFAIGGTKTSCELGGEVATLRRTASGKLWPGSVLIELAPEDGGGGGTPEADVTVDVRFDGAEGTVAVGSTTLSLSDAEAKESHKRWLQAPDPKGGRGAKSNLLQIKARLHDGLDADVSAAAAQPAAPPAQGALRQPKQPAAAHPRPPPRSPSPEQSRHPQQPADNHPRRPPARTASGQAAAGSPRTMIMVETAAGLVAPGSPVTRFRSKFFGKPSAAELTESLRSVLGVDAGKLEVVDPATGTAIVPSQLADGCASLRLMTPQCRSPA